MTWLAQSLERTRTSCQQEASWEVKCIKERSGGRLFLSLSLHSAPFSPLLIHLPSFSFSSRRSKEVPPLGQEIRWEPGNRDLPGYCLLCLEYNADTRTDDFRSHFVNVDVTHTRRSCLVTQAWHGDTLKDTTVRCQKVFHKEISTSAKISQRTLKGCSQNRAML